MTRPWTHPRRKASLNRAFRKPCRNDLVFTVCDAVACENRVEPGTFSMTASCSFTEFRARPFEDLFLVSPVLEPEQESGERRAPRLPRFGPDLWWCRTAKHLISRNFRNIFCLKILLKVCILGVFTLVFLADVKIPLLGSI